jgi:hypothetical protein
VTAAARPITVTFHPSVIGEAPEIGLLPCDVARPYTIGVWDGASGRGAPDASASRRCPARSGFRSK